MVPVKGGGRLADNSPWTLRQLTREIAYSPCTQATALCGCYREHLILGIGPTIKGVGTGFQARGPKSSRNSSTSLTAQDKPPVAGLYLPLCHGVMRGFVRSSFELVKNQNEHNIRLFYQIRRSRGSAYASLCIGPTYASSTSPMI